MAVPITSLILLRILNVATSSEVRNRCCFASSYNSRSRLHFAEFTFMFLERGLERGVEVRRGVHCR
jgi:hypothetical protein